MSIKEQTFQTLTVEQQGRIVHLTLDNPKRHNAISRAMQAELVHAVEVCAQDSGVNVVVIRGAGRSFSAGYDVTPPNSAINAMPAAEISIPRRAMETIALSRGWSRLWNAPIPLIAQIHGHCLAGGTDLALHCDLVMVANDATIGFPALRMGGTPPTNMWLYNVGPQWAKRLLFTGDTFTGRLGAQIGFALEAVPAEELAARVMALARRIAEMGKDIVAINKFVLNKGLDLMGRATLQELSAPMDCIANQASEMNSFTARAREIGIAAAFKERDLPFADGVPLDVAKPQP